MNNGNRIPKQLQNKDFRFIRIKQGTKSPIEKEWPTNNYQYDSQVLQDCINNNGSYGVVCGFGNLVVIDIDDMNISEELCNKLPQTFTVKTGSGKLHKYFTCDQTFPTIRIPNANGDGLMDVQCQKVQVLGPGSLHPNGNRYEVLEDLDISQITKEKIDEIIQPYIIKKEIAPVQPDKINVKPNKKQDELAIKIKEKIRLSEIMSEIGFNTSRNPTECIFHGSKGKANFSWDDGKGVGHCFHPGCDANGDVINLYMKYHKYDFTTAVTELAEKVGIVNLKNYTGNAEIFWDKHPYHYDKAGIFWMWDYKNYKWEIVDEIDMMNAVEHMLDIKGKTVTNMKSFYLEALRRFGRLKKPKDAPKEWVQFKDKIFDIKTKEIIYATPNYFTCSPIPWEIGEMPDTPILDKLMVEWVGEEGKQALYEMIAYCCYTDYPIHLIFCLIGSGRNGKTSFVRILTKFLGLDNIASTELDQLTDNRFESCKLYKKLLCTMGETNFGVLNRTSLIKKLCGQDLVSFEFKHKLPFNDYNYAKILICSNSLPSTEDMSEGFYRRWMITDFKNEFNEGKDIINNIPDIEFNNLAKKITEILPGLIEHGTFKNQGTIAERKERFIMASNPLSIFIDKYCDVDPNNFIPYQNLFLAYKQYLTKNKKRIVSNKEFSEGLDNLGYLRDKTTKQWLGEYKNGWFVLGLWMKDTD